MQDVLRRYKGLSNMSYLEAWNWAQNLFYRRIHDPVVPLISINLLSKSLSEPFGR
jgi:hypothetical protein